MRAVSLLVCSAKPFSRTANGADCSPYPPLGPFPQSQLQIPGSGGFKVAPAEEPNGEQREERLSKPL